MNRSWRKRSVEEKGKEISESERAGERHKHFSRSPSRRGSDTVTVNAQNQREMSTVFTFGRNKKSKEETPEKQGDALPKLVSLTP